MRHATQRPFDVRLACTNNWTSRPALTYSFKTRMTYPRGASCITDPLPVPEATISFSHNGHYTWGF